jgi:hypothetical protein
MSKITAEMFSSDDGTVKETNPKELLAKIIELSKNDPKEKYLDGNRANLILIRRFANKLSKSV